MLTNARCIEVMSSVMWSMWNVAAESHVSVQFFTLFKVFIVIKSVISVGRLM